MILKKILFVALISLTSTGWAGTPGEGKGEEPKNKNLLIFKTEKKFSGAKVEILTADGALLTAQNVQKRKVIIDFNGVEQGTYTIRLSKGNDTREFQYEKKR